MTWNPLVTGGVVNKWANKKANFMGDSITFGFGSSKTYCQYLLETMGFSICRNYGINSSTVADGGSNPMHARVSAMDADADLVCVFGGTNDFASNKALGNLFTVDGSGNRVISTDTTTFYGALHTLCKNLISRYPGKLIILFTPLHREKLDVDATQPASEFIKNTVPLFLEDYVDAIVKIGKWYGIPILDLFRVSGMQPNEPSQKTVYFSATDALHPNTEGHRVIGEKIRAFLNTV